MKSLSVSSRVQKAAQEAVKLFDNAVSKGCGTAKSVGVEFGSVAKEDLGVKPEVVAVALSSSWR